MAITTMKDQTVRVPCPLAECSQTIPVEVSMRLEPDPQRLDRLLAVGHIKDRTELNEHIAWHRHKAIGV